MVHTVIAMFTFKEGAKSEFLDILHSDNGISVTRNWEGCQSIELYESQENPNVVTIWQKWDDKSNHESYVQMRKDSGMFDKLHEMTEDIAIHPLSVIDESSQENSATQTA